jgi:ethanolamine utilization microcompartment shell protein EutL
MGDTVGVALADAVGQFVGQPVGKSVGDAVAQLVDNPVGNGEGFVGEAGSGTADATVGVFVGGADGGKISKRNAYLTPERSPSFTALKSAT